MLPGLIENLRLQDAVATLPPATGADGSIVDPGGPVAGAVPAMPIIGLVALVSLLLLLGAFWLRRREAYQHGSLERGPQPRRGVPAPL